MRLKRLKCIALLAAAFLGNWPATGYSGYDGGQESEQTVFSAKNAIESRSIANVEFGVGWQHFALFSPDRAWFVIRTNNGNLADNSVYDCLVLFYVPEVESYLRSGDDQKPPKGRTVIARNVVSPGHQISSVRWLNSQQLAFVAQADNGTSQIFQFDVLNGKLDQISHHSTDVMAFDVSGDVMLFYAVAEKSRTVARVGDSVWLGDLLVENQADEFRYPVIDLFVGTKSGGPAHRITTPSVRLRSYNERIWLSPSGKFAITLAPATDAPSHWQDYRVWLPSFFRYSADRVSSDPKSVQLQVRLRYQLVELKTGTAHPLFDAPAGDLAANRTPPEVFWVDGGNTAIVTNTFLPLQTEDKRERARRVNGPAIVEVDLQRGDVKTIIWEPVVEDVESHDGVQNPIVSVDWNKVTQALTVRQRVADGKIQQVAYTRDRYGWKRHAVASGGNGFSVSVKQDMNVRPKLFAADSSCGCEKELFDPDPNLDRFAFGHVEALGWVGADGIKWSAGLLLPPHYVAGRRYPVVVQTHGFNPGEFLMGGPTGGHTTAFAAQSLASAGIVVLQVGDSTAVADDVHMGEHYAEGYRAGIKKLISDGIADADKIGLIAYSFTGAGAVKLLIEDPQILKAATLSDAALFGFMGHLQRVNAAPDYKAQVDATVGPVTLDAGLGEWFASNPIYQLGRTTTAVRMEALSATSAIEMWETYAILRYANRPVDFLYFPDALHALFAPAQRLESQGGNVDWFRFWLQGYEDPDPDKVMQYQRWRKFREQRDAKIRR